MIPFKRRLKKLPRTGANKGANKTLPSCTNIYFYFFYDVLGFRSSRILSTFLLISLFTLSLTLLFLSMILMAHSLITLTVSSFKCFHTQLFFSVLWKNNLTLSTRQNLLNVLRHADSSIATLQTILFVFQCAIYTCCRSSKMLLLTWNLSSLSGFKSSIK